MSWNEGGTSGGRDTTGIETTMGVSGGNAHAMSRMVEYASVWVIRRGFCTGTILKWP